MVCGGFTCSKNSLAALNVLYILLSFILIGVAAYGRLVAIVTNLALVGSIIACGVFLFLTALIGLIGACKHHQVLLFFYMIILFLLFLLQFSLACACLAVNETQRTNLASSGWSLASNKTRVTVQNTFDCCGFDKQNDPSTHPSCDTLTCCSGANSNSKCCMRDNLTFGNSTSDTCPCTSCAEKLKEKITNAFRVSGGIGLFFSFTEIIGIWLALRYRNLKDPKANPSAFL